MDFIRQLPRLSQLVPEDGKIGGTTVDIIAVHGVETTSPKTWIAFEQDQDPKGQAFNWLCDADMLPSKIPGARIWVYDYNSNWYSNNAQELDVLGHGQTFLEHLWNARKEDKGIGMRPLVFIGSCFGGVVVAQALERANHNLAQYAYLLESTVGVVFLGAPLKGTVVADRAQQLACVRGAFGLETSTATLKGLQANDKHLENIVQGFARLAISKAYQIVCFYETRKTNIANAVLSRRMASVISAGEILVPKESACLDGQKHAALDVRHAMINKFRGPKDGNYNLVSNCLRDFVENGQAISNRTDRELQCLESLTSDYREGKDRNVERVPGTCLWALENEMFRRWREKATSSVLWISADPGCGKSVLSKSLVDEGLLITDNRLASTCYFFFKDDDVSRQTGANALSAILHQLFAQRPRLLKYAMPDFEKHGRQLRTKFSTLWDILEKSVADPSAGSVICLLDGLDECWESEREILIKKLSRFNSSSANSAGKLKFIVTSRPYHDIAGAFHRAMEDVPSINLRGEFESNAISNEIELVIDYQVPRMSVKRRHPFEKDVQDALINKLKGITHRTYLWLHHIFEVLKNSSDSRKSRLEALLDKLPSPVNHAYEKMLQRIENSDHKIQARRLFHIVIAAARPLSLREMNLALAIDEKIQTNGSCHSYSELDLEPEDQFRDRIREVCGLFICIDDSKIYLIHHSAKEFLLARSHVSQQMNILNSHSNLWKHTLNFSESNLILTRICVCYLLFQELDYQIGDELWLKPDKWMSEDAQMSSGDGLSPYDFLNHAAQNWTSYFRQASVSDDDITIFKQVLDVCDAKSNTFARWDEAYHRAVVSPRSRIATGSPAISVMSYFGLSTMIKFLFRQNDIDINQPDINGRTPLFLAISNHHLEAAKLVLESDDVDINLVDKEGRTPLLMAVITHDLEAINLLLERDDVNANLTDKGGYSPLLSAILSKDDKAIELLLQQPKINVNAGSPTGESCLSWAIIQGHARSVELLLSRDDIDINKAGYWYFTPLFYSVNYRDYKAIEVLLGREDIDTKATNHLRPIAPFSSALLKSDVRALKDCLRAGNIDVNGMTIFGLSPLFWADICGNVEVIELLRSAATSSPSVMPIKTPPTDFSLTSSDFQNASMVLGMYRRDLIMDFVSMFQRLVVSCSGTASVEYRKSPNWTPKVPNR